MMVQEGRLLTNATETVQKFCAAWANATAVPSFPDTPYWAAMIVPLSVDP